jgi:hypothetical protein
VLGNVPGVEADDFDVEDIDDFDLEDGLDDEGDDLQAADKLAADLADDDDL